MRDNEERIMKGILRGAYCVALSISIFLCGVILALSCRGITLYKKELLGPMSRFSTS